MPLHSIDGGFSLSSADENLVSEQRGLTLQVNEGYIQVGAVFIKISDKAPFDKEWFNKGFRDTKIQSWIDDPTNKSLNIGFNLQFGWVDIDIDSDDADFHRCVVAGLKFVGVDTRFQFGRLSVGAPSHVFVQLNEDESDNFYQLKQFEPNGFTLKGVKHKVELRSIPTNIGKANVAREAKQTVMPGSVYPNKKDPSKYDPSVWYRTDGTVAHAISHIASTTAHVTSFNTIVRGIAFGTALYLLKPQWVEGSRQIVAAKVSGWLARVVKDSQGINNHEILADDVFCPIDSDDYAENLLRFICEEMGDDEVTMRIRIYHDARRKLEQNPDAKIPGWPTMSQFFGEETIIALRAVLMPGADVSKLTQYAERYLFDESDNKFIDRTMFRASHSYTYKSGDLSDRHKNDELRIGDKKRSAWKIFETSPLRTHVSGRDLYPNEPDGIVFRVNGMGQRVADDDETEPARMMFNEWRGWSTKPAQPANPELLTKCVDMFHRLLGYLTQENKNQMEWMKQWIAWTLQHPGTKQQIAPVIVGGQGVGKSFFGNTFCASLFHPAFGTASPRVLEGVFAVEPFIGNIVTFIDETKLHSEGAIDELKKLIRNIQIGGSEKYQSARTYNIYSRVILASNYFAMNLGQANVQDRALYYIKSYDKEYLKMNDSQWRQWVEDQKSFFDGFARELEKKDVREHFMHYFMEMPVDRYKIENTEHSSAADSEIIAANMSSVRLVAKTIIEEQRVMEDSDITMPFMIDVLNRKAIDVCLASNIKLTNVGGKVLKEFVDAGIIEKYMENGRNMLRFKYKSGTLTEKFGTHISVKLEPQFEFTEEDYGENDTTLKTPKSWKGLNKRVFGKL